MASHAARSVARASAYASGAAEQWRSASRRSRNLAGEQYDAAVADAQCTEELEQVRLLTEIIGNPFRPYTAPSTWPSSVVHLAEALYAGSDCRLPRHDVLLEAGHPELAEHFRGEDWHPKGCWALDAILGRS